MIPSSIALARSADLVDTVRPAAAYLALTRCRCVRTAGQIFRGVGERLDNRQFWVRRREPTFQTGTHDVVLIDDREATLGTERLANHREPPSTTDQSTLAEAAIRLRISVHERIGD